MLFSNFPKIVKRYLAPLPKDDYPVLDSFTFVSCWLGFSFDQSLDTMRSLFSRLNSRDISLDISTFSKRRKQRDIDVFVKIFERLQADIKRQLINKDCLSLFPLDSTIVTLTSKLLWQQEYHQVKLFAGTDNERGIIDGVHIHFGQGHDSEHGDKTIAATPQNGFAVMDRGFSSS